MSIYHLSIIHKSRISNKGIAILEELLPIVTAERPGLMSADMFVQMMLRRTTTNYDMDDTALPSGLYSINKGLTGIRNTSGIDHGMLVVFNGKGLSNGGSPIMQIVMGLSAIKCRLYWLRSWGEWRDF